MPLTLATEVTTPADPNPDEGPDVLAIGIILFMLAAFLEGMIANALGAVST